MAAALIPLALQVAPAIIDLIASLVHRAAPVAEQKYGPNTGPVKYGDVFADVIGSLQKAAMAGSIGKDLPSDETVKVVIQAVVSSMKLSGVLGTEPTPVAAVASGQAITLRAGQSVTISVGL